MATERYRTERARMVMHGWTLPRMGFWRPLGADSRLLICVSHLTIENGCSQVRGVFRHAALPYDALLALFRMQQRSIQ